MAAEQTTEAAAQIISSSREDVVDVAMNAINTVVSLASWTLAALGVLIALLAVFGWWELRRHSANSAKKTAKQVADKRLDAYLTSDEVQERLSAAIEEQVQKRVAGMIVVTPSVAQDAGVDGEQFPEAPEEE